MSLLSKIDAITSCEYGFRVYSLTESGEQRGNELVGMVRIAREALSEREPDEITLAADKFACSLYFEGGVEVVKKDLRELAEREIAIFFSTIFEKYKPVVVHGHKHLLKSLVVKGSIGNPDPVRNDPLILIFGNCEKGIAHNGQPEHLRGLNFYERRLGELEKQRNNLKRLQMLVESFNNFFVGANKDSKLKAEDKDRLQSLNERMMKAVSDPKNKMSEAKQEDHRKASMPLPKVKLHGIQEDEKRSRLNSELNARLAKAKSAQAEEGSKIGNGDTTKNADCGCRLAALEVQLDALQNQTSAPEPAKFKALVNELSSIASEKDAEKNFTQIQALLKKMSDLTQRLQSDLTQRLQADK